MFGDRIVTVSATLMAAGEVFGQEQGLAPPFLQTISARGFPTVALDLYSFFPFAESTFDVVHSSWAYTGGFTRLTILEMYRILRPGGYMIHNVWDGVAGSHGTLLLEEMAQTMNWTLIRKQELDKSHDAAKAAKQGRRHGSNMLTIYQIPAYRYTEK